MKIPPVAVCLFSLALGFAGPSAAADEEGDWIFWKSSQRNSDTKHYTRLEAPGSQKPGARPRYAIRTGDEGTVIEAMPKKSPAGLGEKAVGEDLIAGWECPAGGDWLVKADIRNLGTDVRGGDGGWLQMTVLGPEERWDNRFVVRNMRLPSSRNPEEVAAISETLALEAGDRVVFRFNAGVDGYGDRFEARVRMEPGATGGRKIPSRGLEGFLPNPPDARAVEPGAPMRRGLYWLGASGIWGSSEFAEPAIGLIRRFVPDLAVILHSGFPDSLDQPPFYRRDGIPTIIQNFGEPFVPYYLAKNAFEINWRGEVMDTPGKTSWHTLWGGGHAVAMPSEAFRTAWRNLTQASVRLGYSGVGFADMVWFWAGGRGRTGFHPETIAAFRSDLQGLDEGLDVHMGDGKVQTFHFEDYANYYFGGMPGPEDLGFDSWADYKPVIEARARNDPPENLEQHFMLFDVLVHYEWLKAAQFIGKTALAEGGVFQCMGNPEDMANGVDNFFLARLASVSAISEEYFKNPQYVDGAYHRYPYMVSMAHPGLDRGLVLESGHGGNNWPYYANGVAYATAYEMTLSTGAQHVEGDFWPSQQQPLEQLVEIEQLRLRFQQLLAFGLGFQDARGTKAARIPADFLSVTSRGIFRPWGEKWNPWSHMWFHLDTSPDPALVGAGLNFACMGEDGLGRLEGKHPVIVYAANPPTRQGFDRILERLRSGATEVVIMNAPALQDVIDHTMRRTPLAPLYPGFAVTRESETGTGGVLADAATGTPIGRENIQLEGPLYSFAGAEALLTLGGKPVAVSRDEGKGRLIVLLFDPGNPANRAAASVIYTKLLADHGIAPRWRATPGTVARLYEADDLFIVGAQNPYARDWDKRITRPDDNGQYVPYHAPETSPEIRVLMEPGQTYCWAALPSGTTGSATADEDGWVNLAFEGTSWEVFHLLPDNEDNRRKRDSIAARKSTLDDAMQAVEPKANQTNNEIKP